MDAINYILIGILSSGLLFLYYWIFLRNKSFHRFNRYYLLGNLILPLILPLLHFNLNSVPKAVLLGKSSLNAIPKWIKQEQSVWDIHWEWVLWAICLTISISLWVRFLIGIIKLYRIRKGLILSPFGEYNLLFLDTHQAPFSFLKDIYWSKEFSLDDLEGRRILEHEICHIRERHTYDKLFSQFVLCFLWMNPFYYLIDTELSLIHEFIADEVSFPDRDVQFFAHCLLKIQSPFQNLLFTQSFFQSPIKRRLAMIKNTKTTHFALLRRVITIPFALILISFFSIQKLEANNVSVINKVLFHFKKDIKPLSTDTLKKKVYFKVKRKANGKITQVYFSDSSKVMDTSNHVLIVMNKKGRKLIDTNFKDDKKMRFIIRDTLVERKEYRVSDLKSTLVIINGKEANSDEFKKIEPGQILKVEVFKGDEAVKKYGERGRSGVIVMTTKNK